MGQNWGNDLSGVSREQPALWRRIWFWIKQIALFPVRMAGLLLVFIIGIGGFGMWVIPDMAERYKVDMVLLVLRLLDEEGAGRPFRRLGYQDTIQAGLLNLRPDESSDEVDFALKDPVVAVNKSGTPQGEAYVVRYASGQTQTLVPTTPHTSVPPEELAAARQGVSRLFSPRDHKHWTEVVKWGESLFVTSWVQKYDVTVAPRDRFPGPVEGTEDEQLWCVWQALRCGGARRRICTGCRSCSARPFPKRKIKRRPWPGRMHSTSGCIVIFFSASAIMPVSKTKASRSVPMPR